MNAKNLARKELGVEKILEEDIGRRGQSKKYRERKCLKGKYSENKIVL